MVVSKTEFNDALIQINQSYAKMFERVEKLEARVAELEEKAKPKTRTQKASKEAA